VRPDREAILARYDFPLDRFQIEAADALDAGQHVVVAAPTGSGKTVVAEYGIAGAVADGRRAFYTAPIKALSNQKYHDLVELYGDTTVGLLTGDNAINPDAPVVVMTTEVLRNMIYAKRPLDQLAVVVLDEVHYLQDTYRGPVWEEVIIHLPQHVQLICLSATVSNANELAEWIETVRGPTHVVLEERRPVQLDNFYYVHDVTNDRLRLMPTLVDGRPNPDAVRLDASAIRFRRGRRDDRATRGSGQRKLATPGRVETVERLAELDLLPAIYFIFSRNQCEEAARTCVNAGLRLTDDDERVRIRSIADARLAGLAPADLDVLGHTQFMTQLEAGFAPHHAGMVPPFKEVVEACFTQGLVKVVFATETLAVGINMPARSVVIDKLTKFTGDRHETLSPGQYTQLTGRAGRRGIDEHGTAVVLWSPFVPFDQVAELALSKTFHLRSAFRPTYNMAANLVQTYDATTARQLLTLSFAQFQADRDVVRLERRLQRQRERLAELEREAASPFGDIDEYRRAVDAERGQRGRDDPIELAIMRLRPGAVIHASKGKHHGPVAVVATAHRKGGFRLTAITPAGQSIHLDGNDFEVPPEPIGTVVLPGVYSPNRNDYRAEVAKRVKQAKLSPRQRSRGQDEPSPAPRPGTGLHPIEDDPDLKLRLRAANQADRVRREIAEIEARVLHRNATLAREFDGVLAVLGDRRLVDVGRWRLTAGGETLARVFHESDLLVTEAIRHGMLDGCDAPTLAGLVSTFVYEHRSPDDPPLPWFPSSLARQRWGQIEQLSIELAVLEQQHGLAVHRPPEPTFFAVAYAWVAGEGFAEVVGEDEMTGGDFVRTVKQLIDLLGQVATVATNPDTRATARRAADACFRGVIADASVVAELAQVPELEAPVAEAS
jgi:ATP-dependent RNA helicase HelY